MSNQQDTLMHAAATSAQPLHERSDAWLATILGRDLQGATLRGIVYLLILGVVLATVAALVG